MIRVLVAEDSPTIQRMLVTLLNDLPEIKVVGIANDGLEAMVMCRNLHPDLITMDIFMPKLDGLKATQQIMKECPTRIVIITSSIDTESVKSTFKAIQCGAVDVIEKPHGVQCDDYSKVKKRMIRVIEQIMEAQPHKRQALSMPASPKVVQTYQKISKTPSVILRQKYNQSSIPKQFRPKVICLGGSTGAAAVLSKILPSLPENYPFPIVIAQHIASGFGKGMANWLGSISKIKIRIAQAGDVIQSGLVLVAPDNAHVQLKPTGRIGIGAIKTKDPFVPSIDRLFESAAASFGPNGLGIILSGMGRDGCSGLKSMREVGALTLAQDEKSSVVYGMPLVAYNIGAVERQMDPRQMIDFLRKIAA